MTFLKRRANFILVVTQFKYSKSSKKVTVDIK